MIPTQIADAPVVDCVEGIYIAKAPNGNLLLATIRTMQNSGEHIVVSSNALAAMLRAGAAVTNPGRTHWEGCERAPGHHGCALAKLDAAEAAQAAVTRVEVIDHRADSDTFGRAFVAWDVSATLSYQDNGRTLKVFVDDAAATQETT